MYVCMCVGVRKESIVTLSFFDRFGSGMARRNRAAPLDAFLGVWLLCCPPKLTGGPHTVTMSFLDGFGRGPAFRNQAVTLCVPGGLGEWLLCCPPPNWGPPHCNYIKHCYSVILRPFWKRDGSPEPGRTSGRVPGGLAVVSC